MRYLPRELERQITAAAKKLSRGGVDRPAALGQDVSLAAPAAESQLLLVRGPGRRGALSERPAGLSGRGQPPAILDEIQNVPEVFNFVGPRSDRAPRRAGQWFLTGSQESGLMRNITESMAGRAAVLQLLPMSARETPQGRPAARRLSGSPRPANGGAALVQFLPSDLPGAGRAGISAVQDLAVFRRFLALVASRHGQVLNKSDLAAPLGMSVPGIGEWLDILEATGQILLVLPYFENLGKRLIKSPKLYVADSGLACHLLGIETPAQLERSPFLGPIFEGFIAGRWPRRS